MAVQRVARKGRSGCGRSLGQRHSPQTWRLLDHGIHSRNEWHRPSMGREPWHGRELWLQPRRTSQHLPHWPGTGVHPGRHGQPRRQPPARHRSEGRRNDPRHHGRTAYADGRLAQNQREAIYGTRPWKNTRQWTAGEVPKVEYNKEYSSAYDVTKLIEESPDGKASIEAFFTSKDNEVYAILPRWSGHNLVIKDLSAAKSVTLLGSSTPLKAKHSKTGLSIELPDLPEDLRQQPAWVLKISQ